MDTSHDDTPAIPFQAIIEQSLAGIYIMQDEQFVYSNATWAGIVGYTPEELTGMTLKQLVAPDMYETVLHRYYQRLHGEVQSMRFHTRGVHRDGHIVDIEIHGSRMMFRGRPAVGGVGIDISERLRRDEELRRSREQLQQLTAYTSEKLEEQRLTFARDVHDVLGGMLTALKMDVTRIARRAETAEQQALTQEALGLTQNIIETVKAISESLRPSALDHAGLAVAMAHDLQQFSARFGVRHTLGGDDAPLRLPARRAIAVYRVFNEGLTNIARHAQARQVDVTLGEQDGCFVMTLRDDGRGFEPSTRDGGSLGLLSMTERARAVGGALAIDSAPGRGTTLVLRVPLL
ncbi:PAS domain-containing sensor histidine kinase [Mitsuaria sp. GD03876]|uniref:PAS domain-containing sensor histidine kinase n=1 Tax=Mitsuaria sp. GD03876 TaxID=2975399 RepID=UPI00244CD64F|nr:PAS domain-containing sensor histidine kinase [Mitsuaria sp. GD03876]MDH0866502.1 PAS domain-containing sensor histidine kinase [Mitsuaria sp. GD03876]